MTNQPKATIKQAISDVCKKQPFMTELVYALTPRKTKQVPTMGTDGEFLFWNPKFLNTLSTEEAAGVIFHEVLHCAYRHMWREEDREKMRWNLACDFAINPTVNESFPLPKGAALKRKYHNKSAEQIYKKLDKFKILKRKSGKQKESTKKNQKNLGKSGQKKSKSGQKKSKLGQTKPESGKNKSEKDKQKTEREQKWGDHDFWGEDGKKKKEKLNKKRGFGEKLAGKKKIPKGKSELKKKSDWEKLFKDNILKNYGKLPESLQRIIQKEYHIPVINWMNIVSQILSTDESDYTFAAPDRRFMNNDFILPGLHARNQLKDVVFAYDTSGSISTDDLQDFYHETLTIFDTFSRVKGWLAVCDAQLHRFEQFSGRDEFNRDDFVGGGGTAFEPVFEKIKEKYLQPKAVFYFTDTYGSFPNTAPDYPVFWLVKSDIEIAAYYQQPDVPFGHIIEFASRKGLKL